MLAARNAATTGDEEEDPIDPALLLCQRIDALIEQDEEDDDQDERSGR